nr:hypothetical protein TetV2_00547 [Oceanusvirus sp.]
MNLRPLSLLQSSAFLEKNAVHLYIDGILVGTVYVYFDGPQCRVTHFNPEPDVRYKPHTARFEASRFCSETQSYIATAITQERIPAEIVRHLAKYPESQEIDAVLWMVYPLYSRLLIKDPEIGIDPLWGWRSDRYVAHALMTTPDVSKMRFRACKNDESRARTDHLVRLGELVEEHLASRLSFDVFPF